MRAQGVLVARVEQMSLGTFHVEARGIRVALDLAFGQLARIEIERDGRRAAPFHRAPWADEPGPIEGTERAPHLARLSGDFFCAPFAVADVEPAPPHGWTANAPWLPACMRDFPGGVTATFTLERAVMGARVVKELTLRDGHPFLYQRHVFKGGAGAVPVASHAMVSLPGGGRLSFSPKRWAETLDRPLEPDPARGRSILAYPATASAPTALARADGGSADLTVYPLDEGHEDFAMLVEAEGAALGWTAVARPREGDLALMLKNPAVLPVTMLWYSNGGRFYPPWNGRHRHVLGVEDGCAFSGFGHRASIEPNRLNAAGIATAIDLDPAGEVEVRHVIGAAPLPAGFGPVAEVRADRDHLTVADESGRMLALPFDVGFLSGER